MLHKRVLVNMLPTAVFVQPPLRLCSISPPVVPILEKKPQGVVALLGVLPGGAAVFTCFAPLRLPEAMRDVSS